MPMSYFLRWISDQGGVSIVADKALDAGPVTLDVQDVPVSQVLSAVARRMGVQLTRTGSVYYLGNIRPEDRGVMVRRVTRLNEEDLTAAIGTLLSEHGRVTAQPDGVIIVGDRVEILDKITEMLDAIEQAPMDSWVVQLFIVSMTDRASKTLGIDTTAALEIAGTFANASSRLDTTGTLAAALRIAITSADIETVAAPMFVLLDGGAAKVSSSSRIPIAKKSVSDAGTVTTTDYEEVEAGVVVNVGVRNVGSDRARLKVGVEMTAVTGFVEEAPIISGETFETEAAVHSGGVYLLGEMTVNTDKNERSGQLGLINTDSQDHSRVQVWARTYRLGLPDNIAGEQE